MKTRRQRSLAVLLSVLLIVSLIDGQLLSECSRQLKAYAAKSDYAVGFYWETKGLGDNNDTERSYSLSNHDTVLTLTEKEDENPVLRSTFYFNLARAVEPGNLKFTITGLDGLIRSGTLTMNMNDPNLMGTWDIQKNEAADVYTFVNKVRVTSNNETTFTWQFNSREAVNGSDIVLDTAVEVIETITEQQVDPETGEITTVKKNGDMIPLDTNPLEFRYNSIHDENEVKIVCKDINDTDFNNLNVDYDWRSYASILGLKGLNELTMPTGKSGVRFGLTQADFKKEDGTEEEEKAAYAQYLETLAKHLGFADDAEGTAAEKLLTEYPNYPDGIDWDTITLYDAHAAVQDSVQQEESLRSRGIKTSDYFIEVVPGAGLSRNDIMVVNASGSRVALGEYVVDGDTRYGFYDFRGGSDRKAGQSYTSEYRVGVRNDAIGANERSVQLNGYYLVTYQDEQTPVVYRDAAAHKVSMEDEQPVGSGGFMHKFNDYEINNSVTYSGHRYESHAKHYAGLQQLLYDYIFNGKIVTYQLSARTPRTEVRDSATGEVKATPYDLIYEDGAPSITHLKDAADRVLSYQEYDFRRVSVKKLVDGNTVGVVDHTESDGTIVYKPEEGFAYQIYGKSNDPSATETAGWTVLGSGNTAADSEVFLPEGIDEIRLVVKDLKIRADITAYVDIAYTVDPGDYEHIYIDTEHQYEDGNSVNGAVKEDTNQGTRLVNTFYRKKLNDTYEITQADSYTYALNDAAHSNTWLRDSVTTIDAYAGIESFTPHMVKEAGKGSYYSTTITAGGAILSDTQKALRHFAVYSKVPDDITPGEGWLEAVRDTLTFSGSLLGSGAAVDQDFVLDQQALTLRYDEESRCIAADFAFNGLALDSSAQTTIRFSYPAQITMLQFNALEAPSKQFETDTYVTVYDENVKLSAVTNKSLVTSTDQNNPTGNDAAKDAKSVSISALGSQKSNFTEKYVASYYSNWGYDYATEVDGSNAEHLESKTGRMTSEYSYKLVFHRFSTDASEIVTDPILVDMIEGLDASAWHGRVKAVTFDDARSYLDYQPAVYYKLRSDTNVTEDTESISKYKYNYSVVDDAVTQLTKYGKDGDTAVSAGESYEADLAYYRSLKADLDHDSNWIKAAQDADGRFVINQDNVYAVAILYEGEHQVGDSKEMELTAYLHMSAPALSNDGDEANNNRATYNDTHAFAQGYNSQVNTNFPIYSVSDQTMVILRHNVELMKVSSVQKEKRLSGAQFSVYKGTATGEITQDSNLVQYYKKGASEPSLMQHETVDMTGILKLNLAPGIYYYQETKAPSGYVLDNRLYRFRAVADENAVFYYNVDLKTAEQLEQEYLIVNKDTEYRLYQDSVYAGKQCVPDTDAFHVYSQNTATHQPVGYLVYDAQLGHYAYNPSAGGSEDDTVSCTNGAVTLTALPAGSYFIGKSEHDADGYSFSVADNSSISFMILRKSVIPQMSYHLKEQLGDTVSANDPVCHFTKDTNGTYQINGSGEVIEIEPDAAGRIRITGTDDSKTYYFESVSVPEGYKPVKAQVVSSAGSEIAVYPAEQL
ncbi:MAG: hypothetical protein II916_03540, partial [Oscillospiraceae bacterium]|nr:hypothetical protein [Oscillospiraceae bacterium]